MGCLAAQIIAHFKNGIGGFYLYPAKTRDCGEEYIYTVYLTKASRSSFSHLCLKIQAGAYTFFGLPGTTQDNMPVLYDGQVDEFDPEIVQQLWKDRTEEPINDFLDDQVLSTQIIHSD